MTSPQLLQASKSQRTEAEVRALRPAAGIVNAVILAAPFWLLVIAIFWSF